MNKGRAWSPLTVQLLELMPADREVRVSELVGNQRERNAAYFAMKTLMRKGLVRRRVDKSGRAFYRRTDKPSWPTKKPPDFNACPWLGTVLHSALRGPRGRVHVCADDGLEAA